MALWAIGWCAIGPGAAMLGRAGCRITASTPDVFIWSCTVDGPLQLFADLVNGVLASTFLMPVAVAAAVTEPGIRVATLAVVALHVVGFPAALLVAVRMCERFLDRMVGRGRSSDTLAAADTASPEAYCMAPTELRSSGGAGRKPLAPRDTFGLRGIEPS
jgi:hypothetical protein